MCNRRLEFLSSKEPFPTCHCIRLSVGHGIRLQLKQKEVMKTNAINWLVVLTINHEIQLFLITSY